MLECVLGLAAKLALDVIAEGIEEPAQLDMLHALGCQLGQGYLLARPAPAQTVEARLAGGGHVNAKATRMPVLGVRTRYALNTQLGSCCGVVTALWRAS
jgi:predicted signal transduction protein with EAL and GGDEF domain